jgi:hypothetical protein
VVDTAGARVLVLGSSPGTSGVLELDCRNLDGSPCGTPYVALSSTPFSGEHPSGAIVGNDLLVVASAATAPLGLYTCPLSTLACPAPAPLLVPPSTTGVDGVDPVLAADPTDPTKILVAAATSGAVATLLRCGLDGTSCASANLGQALSGSSQPAMTVDTVNGNVVVAVNDTSSQGDLELYACPLGAGTFGTGCSSAINLTQAAGWTTQDTGAWPAIAFDATTATIFVAATRFNDTDNEAPGYFSCALASPASMSAPYACTFHDLSSLVATAQGAQWTPSIAVANGKVLLVTQNDATNSYNAFLFACDVAGGNCTASDISGAGQQCDTGYFPFAAVNGSTLYVAEEALNACPNNETSYGPALSVATVP